MNKVLIVAEHADGRLSPATAKCVSCAASIPDAELAIAVFAADGAAVAAEAAALAGVARVLLIEHAANAQPLAAVLAPQVAQVAAGHSHILGPSSTFGRDLMPRVAALLGVPQLSDVMAVEAANRFKRPVYAGNAIITVETAPGTAVVCTVRVASYQSAPDGGSAAVEKVALDVALPSHTRFVSVSATKSDRPDLQTAGRVVSGGRALGSAEKFDLIYALAAKLNAGVGASRAAVDAGYAPNEMQVGPDRQDHRPGAVRGHRHLGGDPAPDRHQGRANHSCHQQGSRGADLRGGGLRAGRRLVHPHTGDRAPALSAKLLEQPSRRY
jgi:electron transfer flavoprotein alpha subunit